LTPTVFADEAQIALEAAGLSVRILGLNELRAIGADALLAVASGSHEEPRLLVAEWRGDTSRVEWDAALVGKGVTYDSGGLNLKTRPVIEKMKFDMGGAAAVLGAAEALALRKAKANVVVVVPMTENSVGSAGYRPGDVIGSLGGLTIEVINTDAEGRLILADGISYALKHYDPGYIVDVATLTGMITGILHEEYAGLYCSDDQLADGLSNAARSVGEALWRLPLSSGQDYLVESQVADVANLGAAGFLGLGGGSPTAGAKFIQRFTDGRPWAHIDIAGTAWATRRTSRSGLGATGFGVATLDRWVANFESQLPR
jgi:leucyl aminopeptidase